MESEKNPKINNFFLVPHKWDYIVQSLTSVVSYHAYLLSVTQFNINACDNYFKELVDYSIATHINRRASGQLRICAEKIKNKMIEIRFILSELHPIVDKYFTMYSEDDKQLMQIFCASMRQFEFDFLKKFVESTPIKSVEPIRCGTSSGTPIKSVEPIRCKTSSGTPIKLVEPIRCGTSSGTPIKSVEPIRCGTSSGTPIKSVEPKRELSISDKNVAEFMQNKKLVERISVVTDVKIKDDDQKIIYELYKKLLEFSLEAIELIKEFEIKHNFHLEEVIYWFTCLVTDYFSESQYHQTKKHTNTLELAKFSFSKRGKIYHNLLGCDSLYLTKQNYWKVSENISIFINSTEKYLAKDYIFYKGVMGDYQITAKGD